MNMKLYQKLKELEIVEDFKEFHELIWLRAIKVNDVPVDNPTHELDDDNSKIQVGIRILD